MDIPGPGTAAQQVTVQEASPLLSAICLLV
jgi:hypothetical protein